MKKNVILTLLLVVMLSLTACTSNTPAGNESGTSQNQEGNEAENVALPEIDWSLEIQTADGNATITNKDIADLTPITVEATIKNKEGEEKTNEYSGVVLKDVLALANAPEFTTLIAVADDGFEVELTSELANEDDTIISWVRDGELFNNGGPIRLIPVNGSGNQFVKGLTTIKLN